MKTLADTALPVPAVDRRWLWVARLAVLAYVVVSLAAVLTGANVLVSLYYAPPYLLALLGMGSDRYREAALMLAILIGALGMALWLGVLLFFTWEAGWGSIESVLFGLQAATSLLVFLSAHQAVRKRTLGVRVVRGAGQLIVTCALVVEGLLFIGRPSGEAPRTARYDLSATGSLRAINVAQLTYASAYPHKGFARSLAALGPPPQGGKPSENAAGFIDRGLAAGQREGYKFTLTPGPPDQTGAVRSYRIIARPLQYGETGRRSFYTDESGVIRSTTEDRVATAQDPPLP